MTEAAQEQPNDSMAILVPGSPIMTGVNTLAATSAYRCSGVLQNGAIAVASWKSNNRPLALTGVVGGKNRCDLNFFPPSASNTTGRNDFWTGDGTRIMTNCLLYR